MSVRYFSAEQSIAAAGAAFACPEDDFSYASSSHRRHNELYARFKRRLLKTLFALGFVLA